MNHPIDDELLLLVYDELPEPRAAAVESHVVACRTCAEQVAQLERGRVALDVAVTAQPQRRLLVWATLGLAVAATVVGVMITRSTSSSNPGDHWTPTTAWSPTAGYVTGGQAMMDIDVRLTRLEQGRYYGQPN